MSHLVKKIDGCINILEEAIKSKNNFVDGKYNFKYLVVLDFENTFDEHTKPFVGTELIEWPAIIIDIEKEIIYDSPKDYFHYYIKPKINPKLSKLCIETCGITQSMVDNGISIEYALDLWNKWCYNNDLLPDIKTGLPKACIVTCGDWDLQTMWTHQFKICSFGYYENAMLFHSWINIKKIFKYMFHQKKFMGMMRMLNYLNIKHEGKHHSGIDDVKNICKIVIMLYNKDKSMFNNYTTCQSIKKFNASIYDDICYKYKMKQNYVL
eukprot:532735_1